ncbi:MAG: hypothetical protein V4616_12715, partial [Bacteroidota bacterium]
MKKSVILFLALLTFFSAVHPTVAWALTSGPEQPEFASFTPFEQTSLVDHFSGDFKYNIPLLEIDGYPINLAYDGSVSPETEASWVGLGWNLNPGAINRNVRGLPDDFNGNGDVVKTESNLKPHQVFTVKAGYRPNAELLGITLLGKAKKTKRPHKGDGKGLDIAIELGLVFDNYYGTSFTFGFPVTINAIGKSRANASLDIGYSSKDGSYNLRPGFSMSFLEDKTRDRVMGNSISSISLGIPFNSSAGFTGAQLGTGLASSTNVKFGFNSFFPFSTRSHTPQLINDKSAYSINGQFSLGAELFWFTGGASVSGCFSKEKIKDPKTVAAAYGYLYNQNANADNKNVATDYNRESDAVVSKELPLLPVAHPTFDYYSVSGQGIGGTYRAQKATAVATFDEMAEHKSDSYDVGVELNGANLFQGGINGSANFSTNRTGAWTEKVLPDADLNSIQPGSSASITAFESFYRAPKKVTDNVFVKAGELVENDVDYFKNFKGSRASAVNLTNNYQFAGLIHSNGKGGTETSYNLPTARPTALNAAQSFQQLTATEATVSGLDKKLPVINASTSVNGTLSFLNENRVGAHRKGHHTSEIKVTREDGARFHYGLPVYQLTKDEYSFSVNSGNTATQRTTYDAADITTGNNKGMDNFFQKVTTSAYATGYLLTTMVSDDYMDGSNNGPTPDDAGTYVQFNYKRTHDAANPYRWRSPASATPREANYSAGNYSITNDNKGMVTYGEKEVYYVHSIVSKNYIAEFYTSPRFDAVGVKGANGELDTLAARRLHQLDYIKLYSLAERTKLGAAAVPIKTVNFVYDYSLCNGVPNSIKGGKLTLKKVYFTYRNSAKGELTPYSFTYGQNPGYSPNQDYWGVLATAATGGLSNKEFPFVNQTESQANATKNASAWLLTKIEMPTGGSIDVEYESDSYAFVQDKRAMQMVKILGFSSGLKTPSNDSIPRTALSSNLFDAGGPKNYLFFDVDPSVQSPADVKRAYTQYIKNIFFRCYLDVTGSGNWEFVSGFAEFEDAGYIKSSNMGWVKLKSVSLEEKNKNAATSPIAKLGWQNTRLYLNQLINPPLGENDATDDGLGKQLRGLKNTLRKIEALISGFNGSLRDFGYSKKADLSKSFIRLNAPTLAKRGGGARVKQLTFSDNWNKMAGANYSGGVYGYTYSYTTKHPVFGTISSGVAQWEPSAGGGDENPHRQPITYSIDRLAAPNDNLVRELPVGEALYPNGDVGYSEVEVREIKQHSGSKGVGRSIYKFYTAKEFPVITERVGPNYGPPESTLERLLKWLKVKNTSGFNMSQGVSLEFSNMHGVAKSEEVLSDDGTSPISKVEYAYKMEPYRLTEWNDQTYRLVSKAKVMDPTGAVRETDLGINFDVSCDFRECKSADVMGRGSANLNVSGIFPLIIPAFTFFPGYEAEKSMMRTASMIKTTSRTPILERVVKTDLSSTVTERPLVYDGKRGNAMITSLQNQYDDLYYKLSIPAYWAYAEMGPAGRNQLSMTILNITCKKNPVNTANRLSFGGMQVIDAEGTTYAKAGPNDCACAYNASYAAKAAYRELAAYKYLNDRGYTGTEVNQVNTRTDGTYSIVPLWQPNGTGGWDFKPGSWVPTNTTVLRNPNSMEIESTDAIGLPRAMRYTYNQKIPKAMAQNARYKEFFFEHFEDGDDQTGENNCMDKLISLPAYLSGDRAHSGKKSIKVGAKTTVPVEFPLVCPK